MYFDKACAIDPAWGIVGTSLRSPAIAEKLAKQDFLYSLLVMDKAKRKAKIIGSLKDCIYYRSNPERLFRQLQSPETSVVTLTVTEKGYCMVPATGELDKDAVLEDLENPRQPVTALGVLAEGLRRRMASSTNPFAVISCDNLNGNGHLLKKLLLEYCREIDSSLFAWIQGEVSFPCTMVDRITPATTAKDIELASSLLGAHDDCAVPTEAFSQWVVERFEGRQPPWDEMGVEVVGDIEIYEKMKLRVLNAAHFAMAFIGAMLGHETVYDCTKSEMLMEYLQRMLKEEIAPGLEGQGNIDVHAYIKSTLDRFANSGIKHSLSQIKQDGSQKIGIRILDTLAENISRKRPCSFLENVVAAWLAHWQLHFEKKLEISEDQHSGEMERHWKKAKGDCKCFVVEALGDSSVFGSTCLGVKMQERIVKYANGFAASPRKALRAMLIN